MTQALLEAELHAGFLAEAEHYQRALEVVDRLAAVLEGGEDGAPLLQELSDCMDQTAVIEGRLAPLREEWHANGRHADVALRSAINRVGELLQQLVPKVRAVERQAACRRDQLLPEIEAAGRGQRMQRAYGVNMRRVADTDFV